MNRIIKHNSKLPTQFDKVLRLANSFTKFPMVGYKILHKNVVLFIPDTSELSTILSLVSLKNAILIYFYLF